MSCFPSLHSRLFHVFSIMMAYWLFSLGSVICFCAQDSLYNFKLSLHVCLCVRVICAYICVCVLYVCIFVWLVVAHIPFLCMLFRVYFSGVIGSFRIGGNFYFVSLHSILTSSFDIRWTRCWLVDWWQLYIISVNYVYSMSQPWKNGLQG